MNEELKNNALSDEELEQATGGVDSTSELTQKGFARVSHSADGIGANKAGTDVDNSIHFPHI